MKSTLKSVLLVGLTSLSALSLQAVVIDYTGGTAYLNGGGTFNPNNGGGAWNVDYYQENGFNVDFVGVHPNAGFIGTYYGGTNDVIHGHWLAGGIGDLTKIIVSKIGGGTFDLNYFILTSNTLTGGGPASGTEQAFIKANGGAFDGYTQLLPPEGWGFPATQIYLGNQFDGITSFEFYVTNSVDCFGMDEFYIDEAAPPTVPDSGSLAGLLTLAVAGLAALKRRRA